MVSEWEDLPPAHLWFVPDLVAQFSNARFSVAGTDPTFSGPKSNCSFAARNKRARSAAGSCFCGAELRTSNQVDDGIQLITASTPGNPRQYLCYPVEKKQME